MKIGEDRRHLHDVCELRDQRKGVAREPFDREALEVTPPDLFTAGIAAGPAGSAADDGHGAGDHGAQRDHHDGHGAVEDAFKRGKTNLGHGFFPLFRI